MFLLPPSPPPSPFPCFSFISSELQIAKHWAISTSGCAFDQLQWEFIGWLLQWEKSVHGTSVVVRLVVDVVHSIFHSLWHRYAAHVHGDLGQSLDETSIARR